MINLFDKHLANFEVGNKSINLNFLQSKGFNVKRGYVITPEMLNDKSFDVSSIPFNKSIVRSNGVGEDGECSFSGIFKSIINVEQKNLTSAIKEVEQSFYSKKSEIYQKIKKCTVKPAILIQEMIDSKFSAVVHTEDEGTKGMYIEFVEGLCEQIVSGVVTPENITIENIDDYTEYKPEMKFYDLLKIIEEIKSIYNSSQEIELSFDGEKWFVLQTKNT